MISNKRSVLGVTLLEIMLVLAIAGMIIVMSVRYYQSASASNQANTALQQIQGILAGEESVLQSQGAYEDETGVALLALLPKNPFLLPWGTTIGITITTNTIQMTLPSVPVSVCATLDGRLRSNTRISSTSICSAKAGDMVYTYQ